MKILLWVLMGLGGLLLFLLILLILVLLLPARVRIQLRQEKFFLWAGLGPFRLRLLPWKEKKPPKEKKAKKQKKSEKRENPKPQKEETPPSPPSQAERAKVPEKTAPQIRKEKESTIPSGGMEKLDIPYIMDLIHLGLSAMEQFRRALRIDRFLLDCVIATEDAAKTAMAYGAAAAGVGMFLPLLEESLRVREKDIQITCDFEKTESQIFLEIQVSALVFQLLIIGIKVLREFLRLRKQHDQEAVSV